MATKKKKAPAKAKGIQVRVSGGNPTQARSVKKRILSAIQAEADVTGQEDFYLKGIDVYVKTSTSM
jgi:hypothetical protein